MVSGPNLPIHAGINSQAVRAIPESWTAQWFKRFITNHMQWADFRNAIAGPGIIITGTEQQQGEISTTGNTYSGLVADLPASPVLGQRAFVTNSNTSTFLASVAGGGSIKTPVTFNGVNWVVG